MKQYGCQRCMGKQEEEKWYPLEKEEKYCFEEEEEKMCFEFYKGEKVFIYIPIK